MPGTFDISLPSFGLGIYPLQSLVLFSFHVTFDSQAALHGHTSLVSCMTGSRLHGHSFSVSYSVSFCCY